MFVKSCNKLSAFSFITAFYIYLFYLFSEISQISEINLDVNSIGCFKTEHNRQKEGAF